MSLESIVNVSISANSRGVTRKSFGIPLVVAKHDNFGARFKEYNLSTALPALVADGFTTSSPTYIAVRSLASNSPKAQKVVVGRLLTDFNQITKMTVKTPVTIGDIYSFDVIKYDGVTTSISYTAVTGNDSSDVATAIAALIDGITGMSSAAAAAVVTNTADDANQMWRFVGLDKGQIEFEDTTVDTSLATEVGEIDALYPDWYGLILADPNSKPRILALAAYCETLEKIFGGVSYDYENMETGTTTSACYATNAADYFRTYVLTSGDQSVHAGAAWMGKAFPADPGSITWAFKSLSGVTYDILTAAQEAAIKLSKGNTYTRIAGLSVVLEGTMASGEWIDVVRGRDWFVAQIREVVFALLANAPKVPFTDGGVALVVKEVKAVQRKGITATFLAPTPEPFVTYPEVADVAAADKIARLLPDIYFEQTLAGAIHAVKLYGVLKV